jgi:hypothetical protein
MPTVEPLDVTDFLAGFTISPEVCTTSTAPDGGKFMEVAGCVLMSADTDTSSNRQKAADMFRKSFKEYVGEPPGTIYWRRKPELAGHPAGEDRMERYVAYARLRVVR